jgi:hypothetical protein
VAGQAAVTCGAGSGGWEWALPRVEARPRPWIAGRERQRPCRVACLPGVYLALLSCCDM